MGLVSSKWKHLLLSVRWAAMGKLNNRKFRAVKLINSLLSLSVTQT